MFLSRVVRYSGVYESLQLCKRGVSLQGAFRQKLSSGESAEEITNDVVTEQKHASKDRTREIPVETSIKYIESKAYSQTYGNDPVWVHYRRNHKGMYAPKKTRKTCIRQGVISTGNPCPICRDEYLVLHHKNINLLKQFISPHNGEILSFMKTGLCQKRHAELLVAVEKARDYGLLVFDVPLRTYDYSRYFKS
ncbi:28S ribosomal protein S18b, mitochondrial [Schistocerca cancellata]|uniref:28S ribosomal protein S18b, mitochondrial n=1 Tax=Schistocerca cancellata TaxID=274614 RepID=UPI0021179351|nr:28S ribosomal protein S18b, mitochondrial [Schistocerca cancellata]